MIKFGKATGEQETKIREEQDQGNRKPRSERNRIRGPGNQGQRGTGSGEQETKVREEQLSREQETNVREEHLSGEQETKIREEHDQGN